MIILNIFKINLSIFLALLFIFCIKKFILPKKTRFIILTSLLKFINTKVLELLNKII